MANKRRKIQLTALVALQPLVFSAEAFARWDHRQAETLDKLDRLGHEYYNDINSYRAPWTWDAMSEGRQVQIKTHAGSLNQKEFYYGQSARVQTRADAPLQLTYEASRIDDRINVLEQDALILSYKPETSNFKYSLLADGFGDKAYSDMGLGLSWWNSNKTGFYIDLWKVDPFYNLKKLDKTEYRSSDNYSLNLGVGHKISNVLLNASYMHDTPVEWTRTERDLIYKYEKQESILNVVIDEETVDYYATGSHMWLNESLGSLSFPVLPGYSHKESTLEIGAKGQHGRSTSQIGIWGLASETDYEGLAPSFSLASPASNPELTRIERREISIFGTWHSPWSEGSEHFSQWGLFANRINLQESSYNVYTEVKLQWAMDWAVGDQGRFLLGTTWDLDEMGNGIGKGSLNRPWGGGFTQIMLSF